MVPADVSSFHRLINSADGFWRWTNGATESNALVLATVPPGGHLITSAIEHASVRNARMHPNVRVTTLPVNASGRVDPADVRRAIRVDTTLISLMHVNNEVGSIQPLEEVGAIAREHDVAFHTDAAQSPLYFDIAVDAWSLDHVSLSPHKFYGPKGVGLLWSRRAMEETQARPPPAYLAHGATAAIEECLQRRQQDMVHVTELRARLWTRLREEIPELTLNGAALADRHPGNLHVSIPYVESRALLREIGSRLAVSVGSACASSHGGRSHVLSAMGLDSNRIDSSIRLCVGRGTTQAQVDESVDILAPAVRTLRSRSPLWQRDREGEEAL